MAALTPVISLLGTVGSVVSASNTILGGVQSLSGSGDKDDLALEQLKQQQALQEKQLRQNAALEKQQIALDAAQAENDRKQALKRAVARQRAQFSGQGISSAGTGSSQAVLLGLFEESDEERRKREDLDTLKTAAIDQDLAQNRALNVLQRTQLAERQKLQRQLF